MPGVLERGEAVFGVAGLGDRVDVGDSGLEVGRRDGERREDQQRPTIAASPVADDAARPGVQRRRAVLLGPAVRPLEPRAGHAQDTGSSVSATSTEISGISNPPTPTERRNGTGSTTSASRPTATVVPAEHHGAPGRVHRAHDRVVAVRRERAPRASARR